MRASSNNNTDDGDDAGIEALAAVLAGSGEAVGRAAEIALHSSRLTTRGIALIATALHARVVAIHLDDLDEHGDEFEEPPSTIDDLETCMVLAVLRAAGPSLLVVRDETWLLLVGADVDDDGVLHSLSSPPLAEIQTVLNEAHSHGAALAREHLLRAIFRVNTGAAPA